MDPFNAIFIECDIPRSSSELFLLTFIPCLKEFDRLNNMSSETLKLLLRHRKGGCCGLSGSDKLLAFIETKDGGRDDADPLL